MLKPGKNNKKLGWKISKGQWKDMHLYSLTLEERSTCPSHCEQWENCYGNNMPFAYRYDHTDPLFYTKLADQLAALSMKHESGFVIRLHVLGDFFDKKYVHFWRTQLFSLKIYRSTGIHIIDPIVILVLLSTHLIIFTRRDAVFVFQMTLKLIFLRLLLKNQDENLDDMKLSAQSNYHS